MPKTATKAKPAPKRAEFVERTRVLFRAEDPAKGPFYKFNPDTGDFEERPAITAEFLETVARNSDPVEGRLVKEFGLVDSVAQHVIGHEEDKALLFTKNLASAGPVGRLQYDPAKGDLNLVSRLHPDVAQWVDDGLFPKVSARFYEDFKPNGAAQGVGPVLGHVALLGTNQPVAKDLGPWGVGVSDNAERAGSLIVDCGPQAAPQFVVDFAEGDPPPPAPKPAAESDETEDSDSDDAADSGEKSVDLRARLAEFMEAKTEGDLDFVLVDIANAAGVDPELVRMWVAGEVDDSGVPAAVLEQVATMVGVPKRKVQGETPEAAPAADPTPTPAKDEPDETDMAEGRPMPKQTKQPKTDAQGNVILSASDFAEIQSAIGRVTDLEFITRQQAKRIKNSDAVAVNAQAQAGRLAKEATERVIHEFAERMHTSGRYAGPARKQALVAFLGKLQDAVSQPVDFAEGADPHPVKDAMAALEALAPEPVDVSGRHVAGSVVDAAVADAADLESEYADFAEYKKSEVGKGSSLNFSQYATAQGHPLDAVSAFCKAKGHPTPWLDGNA